MKNQKIKIIVLTVITLLSPTIGQAAVAISNPLNVESLPGLVNNVIKGLLGVVGAISLLMIVIGGILWMTSAGNADRVKKGKDTLVWAVIGLGAVF